MSDTLEFFGIYPDVIDRAVKKAESLVVEATGASFSAPAELSERALDNLRDNIDVENIADSIIGSYFREAVFVAENVVEQVGVDISLEYSVDAGANISSIFIKDGGIVNAYDCNSQAFLDWVHVEIISELHHVFAEEINALNADGVQRCKPIVKKLVKAVEDGTFDAYGNRNNDIPTLLQSIGDKVSDVLGDILDTDVDFIMDEQNLTSKLVVYKEGGDIAQTISGKSFVDTFKNEEFHQLLKKVGSKKKIDVDNDFPL